MEDRKGFNERLFYIYNHLSVKEKVIWVLQFVLSVAILIVAALGLKNTYPIHVTNTVDLVLLICLFVICGIKFVPDRVIYSIIYFVLALMMGAILIAGFFI